MLVQRWHTTIGITLCQRWPNVSVPMLAQRWADVGMQPLGQRWANWQIHVGPTLVSRRWPNVRVDVGPTLGQRRNASWDIIIKIWLTVNQHWLGAKQVAGRYLNQVEKDSSWCCKSSLGLSELNVYLYGNLVPVMSTSCNDSISGGWIRKCWFLHQRYCYCNLYLLLDRYCKSFNARLTLFILCLFLCQLTHCVIATQLIFGSCYGLLSRWHISCECNENIFTFK